MVPDPLELPNSDSELLRTFLQAFAIARDGAPLATLSRVASAFARLPYENLTKIVKQAETGSEREARRSPGEVFADHLKWGTGGTCFSLTAALLHIVRALGWRAEPLLADRRYGPDTHCALAVWLDDWPHLLDPGYLLVRPVPLPSTGELCVPTAFNDVLLTAKNSGAKVDLHTLHQGQKTYRLTFRSQPAEPTAFLRAWDKSFDWDMMNYPVISRVVDGRQLYLQKERWLARGRTDVLRAEVSPEDIAALITREFGIAPAVAERALAILRRKGKGHGCTSAA